MGFFFRFWPSRSLIVLTACCLLPGSIWGQPYPSLFSEDADSLVRFAVIQVKRGAVWRKWMWRCFRNLKTAGKYHVG